MKHDRHDIGVAIHHGSNEDLDFAPFNNERLNEAPYGLFEFDRELFHSERLVPNHRAKINLPSWQDSSKSSNEIASLDNLRRHLEGLRLLAVPVQ